jgi:nucleoid-associated protein EbfC
MDMKKMMKQMQKAQEAAGQVQERLEGLSVIGSASGLVTIVLNGQGMVQSIKLDPKAVDADDIEALEDLLVVALRDAQVKANELQQQETQKSMGFLGGMF